MPSLTLQHTCIDQLASWYQYGLFIQSKPVWTPTTETSRSQNELDLAEEFAMWEEASDEDGLKFEIMLKESS